MALKIQTRIGAAVIAWGDIREPHAANDIPRRVRRDLSVIEVRRSRFPLPKPTHDIR